MPHYDLIIIGAGPAGSAAAVTACGQGLSVALIDKAQFPRDKLCGGMLTGRCAKHLEQVFGLSPAADLFETRRHFEFFMQGQSLGRLSDVPPLHLTTRWNFDHQLLKCALEAGAADYTACRISTLDFDENNVTLQDGNVLSFGVLIGADGVQSIVAKELFGQSFDPDKIGFALEIEGPSQNPDEETPVRIDFRAADWGYGWSFPKQESTTIGLGGVHPRNPDMKERLARYLDLLGAGRDAKVKGHFLPFGDHRGRPGRGNVLLAGDAAGFVDPITGEGIGHAIHSGHLAAQVAINSIRKGKPESAARQYCHASRPIRNSLRCARLLRPLIFAGPLERFFSSAFAGSQTLRRDYMRLLSGEVEYPNLLMNAAARLPRAVLRWLLRGRRRHG